MTGRVGSDPCRARHVTVTPMGECADTQLTQSWTCGRTEVGTPDALSTAMTSQPQKTRHDRPGRPALTLVGDHLYEVTAMTSDGQVATAVVAADDEWAARTGLMLVQTTLHLRGQLVTYVVRQIDGGVSS